MKKFFLCLGCLVWAFSCSLEVSESISVKGNPDFRLNMGSPFKKGENLKDYISIDKIKNMAGRDEVYEYKGYISEFLGVKTYVIHYPLVEMKLDMGQYVKDAMGSVSGTTYSIKLPQEIFDQLGGGPLYFSPSTVGFVSPSEAGPSFSIPLDDMRKLVKKVGDGAGGKFGLKIFCNDSFDSQLEVKIPAFGINAYATGTRGIDNLTFSNPSKKWFEPPVDLKDPEELELYVRFTGPCDGNVRLELIFEWESAEIDTSGLDALKGDFPINDNKLGDFLGGAKFEGVRGYVFAVGMGNKAEMQLYYTNTDSADYLIGTNTPSTFGLLDDRPFDFNSTQGDFANQNPDPSYPPLDLTDMLNSGSDFNLNYHIKIGDLPVTKAGDSYKTIRADLVIMLPLRLKIVQTAQNTPGSYGTEYVKLELGEAFSTNDGSDLLGRDDSDPLTFDEITIFLESPVITAVDKNRLAILITTAAGLCELVPFTASVPSLAIGKAYVDPPFAPDFEVLYKMDSTPPDTYATLVITRGSTMELDFRLAMTARTGVSINP